MIVLIHSTIKGAKKGHPGYIAWYRAIWTTDKGKQLKQHGKHFIPTDGAVVDHELFASEEVQRVAGPALAMWEKSNKKALMADNNDHPMQSTGKL